jgi:hypothetical protein
MNNYAKHAVNEFKAAGWLDENNRYTDEMQEIICTHILDLLRVFSDEGHSGSSAPYAINLFSRLAKFEPIAPLTGEDWEWNDTGHGTLQNRRASHVFKDINTGEVYDIDGKVFWEWAGTKEDPHKSYYTCRESRVPVTFPYTVPDKPQYVYRYSDAEPQCLPQTEEGFL